MYQSSILQTSPSLREDIFRYVKENYGVVPEYPWESAPYYAVLRNEHTRKWFGVVMDIPEKKLGLSGKRIVDVLNVKCAPETIFELVGSEGLFPAYHMSKGHWMSVLLDGSVPFEMVCALIDGSYQIIEGKKKSKL